MPYGLAYYPNFNCDGIDRLRRRHDPTVDLIAPHLTIMFPIPDSVEGPKLVRHLERTLKRWQPFQIRIRGLTKSWDHWLFLTLREGNAEVVKLYEEIYTGLLAGFRRNDLEFIPHIAVGLFVKDARCYDYRNPQKLQFDEQRYEQALREAESLDIDVRRTVDKLQLVRFNDYISKIVTERELRLVG